MRYKEQIVTKLEGQVMKIRSLHRSISNTDISAAETVRILDQLSKEIQLVIDRLGLESNE